jgi:hypothetical protein
MSGLKEREKYSAAKRAPKVTADVSTTGPNRDDLKWSTLENRKGLLADVLRGTVDGIAFNAHFDCEGATIFKHACMLGCEGIVSTPWGLLAAQASPHGPRGDRIEAPRLALPFWPRRSLAYDQKFQIPCRASRTGRRGR